MHRLLFSFLFVSLLSPAMAAPPLGLREAEALWRQHSRELQQANANVAGAAADLKTAGQRPNPEVSLNALSISPWSGYGAGGYKDKKMDSQLRIDQLIERGGKRDLRLRGATARLEAASLDLDDTARQQLGILRHTYYNLRLAQEKLALAQDTAKLYGQSADAGKRRLKAGDIAPVDLSRLQIDQARADSDARQAEADLHQAQQALAYLIGRQAEAETLIAADDWPTLEAQALAETEVALEQRPDLVAANRRLQAAEADRDLARARKKRDITVGLQLEHNLQNAPTNSFGLGVSVPLFIWHEYEGEIARAEADLDLARLQLAQQQAQAVGQVAQARQTLLAARDRLSRFENGLRADAERVAKAAEFAYAKGAMGLIDLLDARRTLRQIQIETASARADYAKALADWQTQAEFRKLP